MTPRPVTETDLLAYVDGRLESGRRAEVEAHLRANAGDADRVVADLALQEGLRLLLRPPGRAADRPAARPRTSRWTCLAAAALLAGGFAGGYLTAKGHLPSAVAEAMAGER